MSNIIDEENCPFCKPKHPSCFHSTELVKGIWDGFPLTSGHALLMPHRHVASWFDATSEEQAALISAIKEAKLEIEKQYSPLGYNVGFNDSEAAGQTIFHLHIHVIPRYEGDVDDPRGGIRNIIPQRAAYWQDKK